MEYTFEKMTGGFQVRLNGEFVMYTDTKSPELVDKYLRENGFESREHFFHDCVERNLQFLKDTEDDTPSFLDPIDKEERDSFSEYINQQIEDGYLDGKDGEPIRCHFCDSTNLEDLDHIVEELGTHVVTEYKKKCLDCEEIVGEWAYGYWYPY